DNPGDMRSVARAIVGPKRWRFFAGGIETIFDVEAGRRRYARIDDRDLYTVPVRRIRSTEQEIKRVLVSGGDRRKRNGDAQVAFTDGFVNGMVGPVSCQWTADHRVNHLERCWQGCRIDAAGVCLDVLDTDSLLAIEDNHKVRMGYGGTVGRIDACDNQLFDRADRRKP